MIFVCDMKMASTDLSPNTHCVPYICEPMKPVPVTVRSVPPLTGPLLGATAAKLTAWYSKTSEFCLEKSCVFWLTSKVTKPGLPAGSKQMISPPLGLSVATEVVFPNLQKRYRRRAARLENSDPYTWTGTWPDAVPRGGTTAKSCVAGIYSKRREFSEHGLCPLNVSWTVLKPRGARGETHSYARRGDTMSNNKDRARLRLVCAYSRCEFAPQRVSAVKIRAEIATRVPPCAGPITG